MSIQAQYNSLKRQEDCLQRQLKSYLTTLEELQISENATIDRISVLKKKNSLLAKRILSEQTEKLEQIQKSTTENNINRKKTFQELKKVREKLSSIYDDYIPYIQEQSFRLVRSFIYYIEDNLIEVGTQITTCFKFSEITQFSGYSNDFMPTGMFAITLNSDRIAESSDFYFKQKLFEISDNRLFYSEWYQKFYSDFKKVFFEELLKDFTSCNVSDYFNLQICPEQSTFTLELL